MGVCHCTSFVAGVVCCVGTVINLAIAESSPEYREVFIFVQHLLAIGSFRAGANCSSLTCGSTVSRENTGSYLRALSSSLPQCRQHLSGYMVNILGSVCTATYPKVTGLVYRHVLRAGWHSIVYALSSSKYLFFF